MIALLGAVTPLAVAVLARDRLWHEGVDGFFIAVACSVPVARSERGTWQQRTAKSLLILAAVTFAIVVLLAALLLAAISKNGLPP